MSRLRRGPLLLVLAAGLTSWMPACAGMTEEPVDSPLPVGEGSGVGVRAARDATASMPTPHFIPPPETHPDEATWRRRTEAAATVLTQHPWLRDYLPRTDTVLGHSASARAPVGPCDPKLSKRHSREGGNPALQAYACEPSTLDPRLRGDDASGAGAPGTPLNALIHASSPYLLQHAFNPIDWQTAGTADPIGQRLRLISIGYSTCYWCHRMAEDAFSDPDIGALLNARFHSTKIDREQHPELDARYTRLQRLSGGEVGWPVTVIETADGEPVFVGSYLDRKAFGALLKRLSDLQQRAPAALSAMAAGFRALQPAAGAPSSEDAARLDPVDPDAFLAAHWDSEAGGRAGSQKFPEPALLWWLYEQAVVEGNARAAQALRLQLDRMAGSGLFDPLHGGFFRYATRADWSQPHFEKMLYTQAQLLALYARAGMHWNEPGWLAIAASLRRFSDDWLRDADGLYATAVDARFEGVEGGYYLLSPSEAARWKASHPWLSSDTLESGHPLRLSANALQRPDIGSELATLQRATPRDRERPFIDSKTLTAWNALQALALLEWSDSGLDARAETDAARILEQLWRRFDADSGRLARDQHAEVPGGLIDYALLSQALLAQHARSLAPQALDRSAQLLAVAYERAFGEPSTLDADTARDGELPAPLASLCLALQAQSRRQAQDSWIERADRCTTRLAAAAADQPLENWSALRAVARRNGSLPDRIAFFAEGAGRARWQPAPGQPDRTLLRIDLQPGWHINASTTRDPRLVATRLDARDSEGRALHIEYPDGVEVRLDVFDDVLLLYEGQLDLRIRGQPQRMHLRLQACSDRICLLPEKVTLWR